MTILEFIGSVTVSFVIILCGSLTGHWLGTVYGGIKGAYRIQAVMMRHGRERSPHWQVIKYGLKHRATGADVYWCVGGLEVPVDGRLPIRRKKWWGA